jgi:hypothetical protein
MSALSQEEIEQARNTSNVHFFRLRDEILNVYSYLASTGIDRDEIFKNILKVFQRTKSLERTLFLPLKFVKQHAGLLRHSTVEKSSILKTVMYLSDLVVIFAHLSCSGRDTERCRQISRRFYLEYHSFALSINIKAGEREEWREENILAFPSKIEESCSKEPTPLSNLPVTTCKFESEKPLGSQNLPTEQKELSPPQNMSIRWYKENGWRAFLKEKIITMNEGVHEGESFRIIKYSGTTTQCRRVENSEQETNIPSMNRVIWK